MSDSPSKFLRARQHLVGAMKEPAAQQLRAFGAARGSLQRRPGHYLLQAVDYLASHGLYDELGGCQVTDGSRGVNNLVASPYQTYTQQQCYTGKVVLVAP